jgi:hypothetical protein
LFAAVSTAILLSRKLYTPAASADMAATMVSSRIMNFAELRDASHAEARRLGYATNPSLPLLDADLSVRPKEQIILRALTLHSVVAASYGFPKERSLEWLHQEHLTDSLTAKERAFLIGAVTEVVRFQVQAECLWIFAWALGKVERLDFSQPAADYLVTVYPDLKKGESSARWRENLHLRPQAEILAAGDLAYCLHWAINQDRIDGRKSAGPLKPYIIVERRRALEWSLSRAEWDEVQLDT